MSNREFGWHIPTKYASYRRISILQKQYVQMLIGWNSLVEMDRQIPEFKNQKRNGTIDDQDSTRQLTCRGVNVQSAPAINFPRIQHRKFQIQILDNFNSTAWLQCSTQILIQNVWRYVILSYVK